MSLTDLSEERRAYSLVNAKKIVDFQNEASILLYFVNLSYLALNNKISLVFLYNTALN